MRPLKLHTKTTLLASAITVAVLAIALGYTTARVAEIVREEQKARAELQALNFAEQISAMPAAGDAGSADISDDTKAALRSGLASRSTSARPAGANASLYRVFVPIKE